MEAGEYFAFQFFLFFGEDCGVEGFLEFEQMPADAGQVDSLAAARSGLRPFASSEFLSRVFRSSVGHGGDGLGVAEAGFTAAEEFPEMVLRTPQALCGQPQGFGHPALHVTGVSALPDPRPMSGIASRWVRTVGKKLGCTRPVQ